MYCDKSPPLTIQILIACLSLIIPLLLFDQKALAVGINQQINFQGKLVRSDGTNVADGSYSIVFSIYNEVSGGTAIWTETQNVTVTDGIFQVTLGAVTSLSSIDFNNENLYLGIKVNTDSEMTPRIRFASVPYAFNSEKVNGLAVINNGNNTLNIGSGLTFKVETANKTLTGSGTILNFGGDFATFGGHSLTFTTTGATNVTLPTSGTLFSTATPSNAGDIVFASANNTLGLLAKGTDGQCLKSTATNIAWGNCGTATSLAWSAITDPTSNLTVNHAGYTTVFNSALTTGNFLTMSNSSFAVGASEVGNLLNLNLTNGSSNTSGTSATTGLNIFLTNNAAGAGGTMETYGIRIQNLAGTAGSGIQNNFGIRIGNMGLASTETSYGLYIDSQSGSTNSYAAAFLGGDVGIGTATPQESLDITNGGGAFKGSVTEKGSADATGVYAGLTNSTPTIQFNVNGRFNWQINNDSATDTLRFSLPGSVKAYLDSGSNFFVGRLTDINNTNYFLAPSVTGTSLTVAGSVGIGGVTSPGRTLDVLGNWGGNVVVSNQTQTSNTTITISQKALGYYLSQNSDNTNANITVTFNITGLPDTDGTMAFIRSEASKATTGGTARTTTTVIQINGTQISSVSTLNQAGADTKIENYIVMRMNGAWRVIGYGATAATNTTVDNADLAEWIVFDGEKPVEGDVVSIGDLPITAKKSSKPYDNKLLGVITTSPYLVMGAETENSVRLALSGRVPVKVSTENGPIKQGDYLTSSSIAGVAMKATRPGPVIGKALEDFSCASFSSDLKRADQLLNFDSNFSGSFENQFCQGKIIVFLNVGYADPTDELENYNFRTNQVLGLMSENGEVQEGLQIAAAFIKTDDLLAGSIKPLPNKDLILDLDSKGRIIVKGPEGTEAITFDHLGNAVFSGTVTAKSFRADKIEGLEVAAEKLVTKNLEVIDLLNQEVASQSSKINILENKIIQYQDLNILERLKINHSAEVILDVDVGGKIKANGGLIVGGPAQFKDEVFFDSLVAFLNKVIFKKDVEFEGRVVFNQDSGGNALIKQGDRKVEVYFEKEYEDVPIIHANITLDATDAADHIQKEEAVINGDLHYIITQRSKKGFVILLNKPSPVDLPFSWSAFAVKGGKAQISSIQNDIPSSDESAIDQNLAKEVEDAASSSGTLEQSKQ